MSSAARARPALPLWVLVAVLVACACACVLAWARPAPRLQAALGNRRIASFEHAKVQAAILYAEHPETLYSGCAFDATLHLVPGACPYEPRHGGARAERIEWEHVVPAEAFGRSFVAWSRGDARCVHSTGRPYRGRRCAQKVSPEYRRMEGDLYNIVPEVGEINQIRSNHPMAAIEDAGATLGGLEARSTPKAFMPRPTSRGDVARTYLYMHGTYAALGPLRPSERRLFAAWSAADPVDAWECRRASRIEAIQGSPNVWVRRPCQRAGLWPTL